MSANDYIIRKLQAFEQFEATLTDQQRHMLHRNPDILSLDLIGVLFQTSLSRMAQVVPYANRSHSSPGSLTPTGSPDRKPRKVVNSWMAFRSYYSTLMNDLPQKVRSPMLAMLWKNDVDHGLWELLSAAFSYIRDNHSEDGIPLDQFLGIATQVVPVVPADQYFVRCGWSRVGDSLHKIEVQPREAPKATNVSSAGLVRYCYRQGLISRPPMTMQPDTKSKDNKVPSAHISFASMAAIPLPEQERQAAQSPAELPMSSQLDFEPEPPLLRAEFQPQSMVEDNNSNAELSVEPELGFAPNDFIQNDTSDMFDASSFLVDDFWNLTNS